MTARNAQALLAEHSNEAWRQKFLEYYDLMEILGDCFISDTYSIPDALNKAIVLTSEGSELSGKLTRKEKIKAKEARLMCALSIGHEELFVDIDSIDIDDIAKCINDQMLDLSLRFPLVHGRAFYDAFTRIYEDEKEYLSSKETMRLLDQLPIGVFQYGRFVTGPFGLQKSLVSRSIQSSRKVPAFHCERTTCRKVHPVILQTGDAPINKDRDKIERILEEAGEPSSWIEFVDEIRGFKKSFFSASRSGVLLPLLGDALSDEELRALLINLFDNTEGRLRRAVSGFIKVGNSQQAVSKLDRAELLQLILISREDDLLMAVDRLVRKDVINVPLGDTRQSVIGRNRASGAFQLSAELGHHGIRFSSKDPGHALLRLRLLLEKLYVTSKPEELQELEWQLREVKVQDLDERLEMYYRSNSPESVLRRMVLARRSNIILACHEVGIEDFDDLDDDQIISSLLWKLGFPNNESEDLHSTFWKKHEQLWALTQSSAMGQSERFLEIASPYFSNLEGILIDALAFSAWALISDHSNAQHPFTYDNDDDRKIGLEIIELARKKHRKSDSKSVNYANEKVNLGDLISAFSLLADHLEYLLNSKDEYRRPESDFPEFHGNSEIKIFKFQTTVPFLDISQPSQLRIVEGLRDVSRILAEKEVNLVRNDYSHYRRVRPDIQRVYEAMEAIRSAITKLETLGLCLILFKPSTITTDEWGHQKRFFSGPRSYEHVFTRPTRYDWMGLPNLSKTQYLVRSATFEDPNEVLRFTRRYKSDFSAQWEGFPNRRKRGGKPVSDDESIEHKTESKVIDN